MPSLFSWFFQNLLFFEIYDSFLNNVLPFWVGPHGLKRSLLTPTPQHNPYPISGGFCLVIGGFFSVFEDFFKKEKNYK